MNPSASKHHRYHFGDYELATDARELRCGGTSIGLEPKVLELLIYLVQNCDRAVDKQELQDEIWPDVIVTDASLTRCVMKARNALGDNTRPHEVIKTVHGFGYRFVASLKESDCEKPVATGLKLPNKPSIAVMMFKNISNDPEQNYFCEGITDDIITELCRFRSLIVIARGTTFSISGKGYTAIEIGEKLGVGYVLEGGIQRSGNRLRLNARLVEASGGVQLWAERYDRKIEDLFVVQDELAHTIAATIGGRVEARRGRARTSRQKIESHDLVLRAQALYYQVNPESVAEAKGLLEQVLSVDPSNARALILMAACCSIESWSFWSKDSERSLQESIDYGRRSLELDDTDSLAHALYGEILLDHGKYSASEHHFLKSISLNPNDIAGRCLYASMLGATGRAEEGLEQIAIAERLDPFGLNWIPWVKCTVLFSAGKFKDCIDVYQRMNDPPNESRLWVAVAHVSLGQAGNANQVLRRFLEQAEIEMPSFPGMSFENWKPMLSRYLGYKHKSSHEAVMKTLETAWRSIDELKPETES